MAMVELTPVADELARIRGYLTVQGAKLTPAALVERVRLAMEELRAAAATVPPPRFDDRPAPDEWSAGEVMAHVVVSGERFSERIGEAIDGVPQGPAVTETAAAGAPARSLDEWWSLLTRDREALFALALTADPERNLEQVIEHPFFGRLNWRETLLFLRLHDLDHAGQLAKIAAALG